MKPFLLATLCVLTAVANAQNSVTVARDTTIKGDLAIVLSNDSVIQEGSVLKAGRGSLPNGNFKYCHSSKSSFMAIASASNGDPEAGIIPMSRNYGGHLITVKAVHKEGNKKRGYRYVLKVGVGNIVNYEVELEDAIATSEIIGPNVSAPAAVASPSATSGSAADELKKLKDLFDSGALTQAEYDSAKKKILAKM